MRVLLMLVLSCFVTACVTEDPTALDTDVFLRFASPDPVAVTMDRFEAIVRSQGLTVFARIDHAANAQAAGLALEANQVLIFGNPKAGTQLINVDADIGLDLPMRVLVRADGDGSVLLMHDPAAVATRFGIRTLDMLLGTMRETLRTMAKTAIESA